MPEFCEVGYSATLARAQGHNFKGWGKVLAVEGSECTIKWQTEKKASSHSITDVFLTAFRSIPSSDSASEAPLYLESEHEATDPKTKRPYAQLPSRIPRRRVIQPSFFCSFLLKYHVPAVLQCLTAIIINSLQPCIPAQNFVHFLRLSQSAQSVPSSRFLAQTIIRCTKTSGFASERWFSTTTQHQLHSDRFLRHQVGCIIHHPHVI